MPLGWGLTAVQFGYLTLRVSDQLGRAAALAAATLSGILLPPWYEEFGSAAGAWHYTTSGPAVSETPLWVIATYGAVMLVIGSAALLHRARAWRRAVAAGLAAGAGIFVAGLAGHALLA